MINELAVRVEFESLKESGCPNCGGTSNIPVLSIAAAPVMVCSAFPHAEEAVDVATGDIELAACEGCGFLFSTSFDQALAEAGAQYESSQAASPHFGAFARGLATEWAERYDLKGKHVAEIGCGQGEFLVEMLRAGVHSAVGIDPLFEPAFIPDDMKAFIAVDQREFGIDHITAPCDALISRHALEHIGDVSGFLGLVRDWAAAHPGAPILFEVPGTERILAEGAFWDIFYEHCNYFTIATLTDAFQRAGLCVTRCDLVYDGQYIVIEATGVTEPSVQTDSAVVQQALQEATSFSDRVSRAVSLSRQRLQTMAAEGAPVVLWQGASKAVALMTLLGPATPIDFAVDLNVRRHGNFLPPFALEVRAPETLADTKPGHVVLMNEVYMAEVGKQLLAMGLDTTQLHSINSLFAEEVA